MVVPSRPLLAGVAVLVLAIAGVGAAMAQRRTTDAGPLVARTSPPILFERREDRPTKPVSVPVEAAPHADVGALTPWSARAPAAVYGSLDAATCERRLREASVPFVVAGQAPGVDRPVRLTGPLHGVTFAGAGLARAKKASPHEIASSCLVLALDDLAELLARHDIVRVEQFSMYRPTAKRPASKKPAASRSSGRPSQHELALAIDVGAFVKADGTRLDVKADWQPSLGSPPCASPPSVPTPAAVELRAIVCELRRAGLFNVILTPNANEAHADHFHFDLTQGARWFILE